MVEEVRVAFPSSSHGACEEGLGKLLGVVG
jgi:hypothetical protein